VFGTSFSRPVRKRPVSAVSHKGGKTSKAQTPNRLDQNQKTKAIYQIDVIAQKGVRK
jgi:hypothetical protein